MTSIGEKKTEAVNAYLIKNSKGEVGWGVGGATKAKTGGRGWVRRQLEGLGRVVWVYKIGFK